MPLSTIAVTGGSGRIGQYVVNRLKAHWQVTILDRKEPDIKDENVRFIQTDILDLNKIRIALYGIKTVVHLAAVDLDAHVTPETTFQVNVMGSWNVLQACHEMGIRQVILCSSVTASGLPEMRTGWEPQYLPIDESHPDQPAHPYGVSKLIAETAAQSFTRDGSLSVICLRAMMVALPQNIAGLSEKAQDPDCRWIFAYIGPEDLAEAIECALNCSHITFGVYYITAEDTCTMQPTLALAKRVYGTIPPLNDPARYHSDARSSLFSGDQARRDLGFHPRQRWEQLNLQSSES